jgi:glutamate carboxypeptidase
MIRELHRYLLAHLDEMRADLRHLVEIESPSDDPAALHRCVAFVADKARTLTAGRVRVIEQPAGPHLDIVVGRTDAPEVLILAHLDTVWPVGTLVARPYSDDGRIARGPGVFDMKAGLVQGLWAIRALHAVRQEPPSVRMLINSDEELESHRSRMHIEAAARSARLVFVLEPSLDGALKTARKGAGRFYVSIRGRAAHAGIDPQAGRSAIKELARVVQYLDTLASTDVGTSINVGVVSGGTRANVVAAEARAEVDVRVANQVEAERVTRLICGLRPSSDGLEVSASGEISRPPMERTPAGGALFDVARRLGDVIGLSLVEASTGGASDANVCAALGVPVLDGLGAVGGGAHAAEEHVLVEAMPSRAALVAALVDVCMTGHPFTDPTPGPAAGMPSGPA